MGRVRHQSCTYVHGSFRGHLLLVVILDPEPRVNSIARSADKADYVGAV